MTNTAQLQCEWCGVNFERRSPRGPVPRFCSKAHRQRSYEARQHQKLGAELTRVAAISESLAESLGVQISLSGIAATVGASGIGDKLASLASLYEMPSVAASLGTEAIAANLAGILPQFSAMDVAPNLALDIGLASGIGDKLASLASLYETPSVAASLGTEAMAANLTGILPQFSAMDVAPNLALDIGLASGIGDKLASLASLYETPSVAASLGTEAMAANLTGILPHMGPLGLSEMFADVSLPIQSALDGLAKFVTPVFDFPEFGSIFGTENWEQLPPNLRGLKFEELEEVGNVAFDEHLPLAWVPRPDLVRELLAAESADDRRELLHAASSDVLDDCSAVLEPLGEHPWALAAGECVDALRTGHYAPAQSHAANLIESILIASASASTSPPEARRAAVDRAKQDFDEVYVSDTGEYLVLRPVASAFARWWVREGKPVKNFNRHATAHGVGIAGVFSSHFALTAVMLAVSLVAQFAGAQSIGPAQTAA